MARRYNTWLTTSVGADRGGRIPQAPLSSPLAGAAGTVEPRTARNAKERVNSRRAERQHCGAAAAAAVPERQVFAAESLSVLRAGTT